MHKCCEQRQPALEWTERIRAYTHLRHDSSVLITGWNRIPDRRFHLTARWPASHEKWPYDPRLLTQTIRQSGLIVGHAERGVPLTHPTLLHHLNFTIAPGFRVPPGDSPELDIEVVVTDGPGARPTRNSLAVDISIAHQGETVVRADSVFGWVSPAAYRRLRGDHLSVDWGQWPVPQPVEPATVGRPTVDEVVLAATDEPLRWQLRYDVDNRLLFDHPVDHVPGLALLEGAQQAAHAALAPASFEPTGVAVTYQQYVEFHQPCWIVAEPKPARGHRPLRELAVAVSGVQEGRPAFQAEFHGLAG
ncbi:adhesin [Streptomyces spinoverrucosus]|uniref:Adhesin n=1 Tax=Streptomyces spinoverrucosus TaxID=284043 RepID=A0A4Y3VPY3_9ACTN|nr:ScbA/BarX family gamma-butyrolactone biosynthesis protein [Streptomyces spinoverrucosus]GEC08105.1 adhesin [Streptomyces spinoverrucosus]GHB64773.1 adhesin [Streptomyces spinoverrucosus]